MSKHGWSLNRNLRQSLGWLVAVMMGLILMGAAQAEPPQWLPFDPQQITVTSTHGLDQVKAEGGGWSARIADPQDPGFELKPISFDAGKSQCLYLKMACDSDVSLQIFVSADPAGHFTEAKSFRVPLLTRSSQPQIYALDLSHYASQDLGGYREWKGVVNALRIDIDGAAPNASLRFWGVGVADAPPAEGADGVKVIQITSRPRVLDEREAAFHKTIVATNERHPITGIMTYIDDHFAYGDLYQLAKVVPAVQVGGQWIGAEAAEDLKVEDFPGGVEAVFTLGGIHLKTRVMPLPVGREAQGQEGAALYEVTTDPAVPVRVMLGDGSVSNRMPAQNLNKETFENEKDTVTLSENGALLTSPLQPFTVAVTGGDTRAAQPTGKGGQILTASFEKGQGSLCFGFAKDQAQAAKLAQADHAAAAQSVQDYYTKLLAARIETPVKALNEGFRTAIYNVEYCWVAPVGWTESIHHWEALWHMQYTAAAEWLGQADRSRLCTQTTAEHLLPSGAIPQFMPNGMTKRDFGGSNQFWAWQVRHYWEFTGDKDFAARMAPVLDTVIEQTWKEYDVNRDLLLSWGMQIGNQEDYVATSGNGTTPTIEGINMMKTRAELARGLGDEATAQRFEGLIEKAQSALRTQLWLSDLGRFMYYRDAQGFARKDGQYQTYIYPVLWGITDPLDSWTSMRQLRENLTGPNGEVYLSNNFPNHIGGTWGMQTGTAQQPWGAWGLSAMGLNNEAWRPLKAAADWALDENHRGSWPEIATEATPAYFATPAALYIASTVESIFGLKVRKPEGILLVSPAFPDDWPTAKLTLPEYRTEYARQGNKVEYTVESQDELKRQVKWFLPPARVTSVQVDGQPVNFTVEPGVNKIAVCFATAPSRKTRLTIAYEPLAYTVEVPKSVAEGDGVNVVLGGAAGLHIVSLDDRCGVLASSELHAEGTQLSGVIKRGLLDEYLKHGRIGQMTYSRRTFFLFVQQGSDGPKFWISVDLTLLPTAEAAPQGELALSDGGAQVKILVRNNRNDELKGEAWLRAARGEWPFMIKIPARSEQTVDVTIPANRVALLSPGDNPADLVLPSGGGSLALTLTLGAAAEANAALHQYTAARLHPIELEASAMIEDTQWRDARKWEQYGHQPWASSKPPLEALAGKSEVAAQGLPQVSFKLNGRKFIPVSTYSGRPAFVQPLGGESYKKLYLLVIPFLDNHDVHAPVGRVTALNDEGRAISRELSFPGDLDWWNPEEVVGVFSSARFERPARFGLLTRLAADQAFWPELHLPEFPQPDFWATARTLKTASAVMNVVELDLPELMKLKSVTVEALGAGTALGLVAMTGEMAGGQDALKGTPFMPEGRYRDPRLLFNFDKAGDTQGWQLEGEAFSVAPVPWLFTFPTLNSLAKAGEKVTGRAISPPFTVEPEESTLLLDFQAGRKMPADGGEPDLALWIVDAASGERLKRVDANTSHTPVETTVDVTPWRGRSLRIELVDNATRPDYAWIGLKGARLAAR